MLSQMTNTAEVMEHYALVSEQELRSGEEQLERTPQATITSHTHNRP